MRIIYMSYIGIIFLTLLFAGCDKQSQQSPSNVVKKAYMLANEGKYQETRKYFSSELLKDMKGEEWTKRGGLKGAWDRFTKDGTIEKIEIKEENIFDDRARVKFKLFFRDGSIIEEDEPLKKEDGVWKISLG